MEATALLSLAMKSMEAAVLRECTVARSGVAVIDISTLGKIDLQGPDAAEFLDRVYTNTFSTLAIGSCRYGIMCDTNGMVFDDGVTSRIGERPVSDDDDDGKCRPVIDHLEEWLQTEWPDLRVRATTSPSSGGLSRSSGRGLAMSSRRSHRGSMSADRRFRS